ncbi:hypothetical protein [Lentzea flaviverrucosa]|uniref:Uncharacterized protein n=1 Tax=Lentzea flaviverrucosa TaxID=200379 RepID=A0A1H9XW31_9PSEU|nr:hypothetical protein [Lentzea flaviverrucosa]RDI34437.1 hypothetical protein DFR72_101184 [Lentzea flaviverrucosa]SES50392.1 hypothetical protein SAMN05216195_12023 [Lentzea flaviverrucosa]
MSLWWHDTSTVARSSASVWRPYRAGGRSPQLRLPDHLTTTGRTLVAAHRNDCLLPSFALREFDELTSTDLLARQDWQDAFAHSRLGGTALAAPILRRGQPAPVCERSHREAGAGVVRAQHPIRVVASAMSSIQTS